MRISRRRWLQLGGAAIAAAPIGCGRRGGGERVAAREGGVEAPVAAPGGVGGGTIEDGVLDELLEELHAEEPRGRGGLSTHAPMAIEALCVLGLADRARRWLASRREPVVALPVPGRPIDPARWREALGPRRGASSWEAEVERWGDWTRLFTDELAGGPWPGVVDRWVGRLAPGLSAAATHGVIRTAHAARALARRDTAPRRAELARGLGYWAAAYEELPAVASSPAPTWEDALMRVPRHVALRGSAPRGNIVAGLRAAATLDGFAPVRDAVAPPDDLDAAMSGLTARFAGVYLQHAARGHAIAFVHAITGPAALRRLAPHVAPATARAAFPYAWQAAAAIYAAYAGDAPEPRDAEPRHGPAELAARALANGDEHAIKLTEVLLDEHARRPDPAYLVAAEDAIARL